MSRWNVLANGEPGKAADELSVGATDDELRIALINALERIERLERQVANLRKDLNE